jgi:hypothetical protein
MHTSDYATGALFGSSTSRDWALAIGQCFGVTKEGSVFCTDITATGGKIGGWTIDNDSLTIGDIGTNNSYHMYTNNYPYEKLFGNTDPKNWALLIGQHFGVASDGCVYATGGKIGGWKLNAVSLVNGSFGTTGFHMFTSNYETGSWFGASDATTEWALGIGSKFGVTSSGAVYAKELHASNSGDIAGWKIDECALFRAPTNSSNAIYDGVGFSPKGSYKNGETEYATGCVIWAGFNGYRSSE